MKTFRLTQPITVDGRELRDLSLSIPTVRALRAMDAASGQSEIDVAIAMVAAVTGLPAATVEDLAATDFLGLSEAAGKMFPKIKPAASMRGRIN